MKLVRQLKLSAQRAAAMAAAAPERGISGLGNGADGGSEAEGSDDEGVKQWLCSLQMGATKVLLFCFPRHAASAGCSASDSISDIQQTKTGVAMETRAGVSDVCICHR